MGQEELSGFLDLMQFVAVFKEGGKEYQDGLDQLKSFFENAAIRNGILEKSATYRRWMGLDRAKKQRPFKKGQDAQVGAR